MSHPTIKCPRCLRILKHEATVEWYHGKPYHWRCLERELRELKNKRETEEVKE